MVIAVNELLRRYIAFEDGKWIHDPNMPETLQEEFEKFVENYREATENKGK